MDYSLITENDETYHTIRVFDNNQGQYSRFCIALCKCVLWDVTRKVVSTFGLFETYWVESPLAAPLCSTVKSAEGGMLSRLKGLHRLSVPP